MTPLTRYTLIICTALWLAPAGFAQQAPDPEPPPAEDVPVQNESPPNLDATDTGVEQEPPLDPAIEFLTRLEEANQGLETLYGSFDQVRENQMFSETIRSSGEFWYDNPGQFRCDYSSPDPASFFLIGDQGYYYSPTNKQLDKFRVETDDDAPIHGMLVGFGLEVGKILDVFSVRMAEQQPENPGQVKIDFVSRDTARTLDFEQVSIVFDREALEPRILEMQESQDFVVITLKRVERNQPLPEGTFDLDVPPDVTVFEY